jgi:hypothetical protein
MDIQEIYILCYNPVPRITDRLRANTDEVPFDLHVTGGLNSSTSVFSFKSPAGLEHTDRTQIIGHRTSVPNPSLTS